MGTQRYTTEFYGRVLDTASQYQCISDYSYVCLMETGEVFIAWAKICHGMPELTHHRKEGEKKGAEAEGGRIMKKNTQVMI